MSHSTERDLFGRIIHSLPHAVVVVDRDFRVVTHNPRLREFLPRKVKRVRGRNVLKLIRYESLGTCIHEVLDRNVAKELEFRSEGEREEVPSALRIFLSPMADTEYVLILLEDATERAHHEDQLVELEKLTAMHQLARSVAHELGNPLSVMHSTLHFVHESLRAQGSQELAGYIDVIVENVDRMDELLRTISEFRPPRRPRLVPSNMTRLIADVGAFIEVEARSRGVKVDLRLAQPSPACMVDVPTMKQVFLNLFKNALEAMPDGGALEVTARVAPTDGGDRFVVSVTDTGVGISGSGLGMVFRPLYSTKPRGVGLGLSFCREVVEKHGGEIFIDSLKGKGTTVTIGLPLGQE